jgi:hypothetical protein
MKDQIKAGMILMQESTFLPDSLLLESEPYSSGWGSLGNLGGRDLELKLIRAGWTLFYMAGEIKRTVFGFDKQKAVRTAVKRIIANVTSQKFNCLELTQLATNSFLGMPYVNVSAHARHIQKSSALSSR